MANEATCELHYPRTQGNIDSVKVSLMGVRAADSIRISYDFGRDGWKIEQASRFGWQEGEEKDEDWKEVAFIDAWDRLSCDNPLVEKGECGPKCPNCTDKD